VIPTGSTRFKIARDIELYKSWVFPVREIAIGNITIICADIEEDIRPFSRAVQQPIKTAENGRVSVLAATGRRSRDCVVADAVRIKPVSSIQIPC